MPSFLVGLVDRGRLQVWLSYIILPERGTVSYGTIAAVLPVAMATGRPNLPGSLLFHALMGHWGSRPAALLNPITQYSEV
jgi:hypothetical protein